MMDAPIIAHARLNNQQIAAATFTKAKDLVAYMGAIQAQDYAMAKWAIGLRLSGSTQDQIEKALDQGDIIHTHVLRPTWHFVAAADIYWMLALSAGRIKSLMKTNDKQLGLTEKIFTKSNSIIEQSLQHGGHLSREEISAQLAKAKILTGGNRLSHLLLRAELEGIACSGKMKGGKRTYALLEKRVPKKKILNREESLALLAKKYFISRGPATVKDFAWWSGLPVKDATLALEQVKSAFIAEKINGQVYWFSNSLVLRQPGKPSAHLLPAFDEFIISYKDRSAALAVEYKKKTLTANGIFNPVIVVNGQVVGLWKRVFQKEQVIIEAEFFKSPGKTIRGLIKKEAKALGRFLGMDATVSYRL